MLRMKLPLFVGLCVAGAAHASKPEVHCRAINIYESSFFGESFSLEENTELRLQRDRAGRRIAQIGERIIGSSPGDRVLPLYPPDDSDAYEIISNTTNLELTLAIRDGQGILQGRQGYSQSTMVRIADLVCN